MRSLWLAIILPGWCITCLGQVCPKLPELDFDRRGDGIYMDSLLTLGRTHRQIAALLPPGRHKNTLHLEGLRFMALVFKQMRGQQRDSSFLYAQQLEQQALRYHNMLYAVRGMMLEEHYLRTVKGNYPQALRINQHASELCVKLPRESSPRWQVQMNMGDIYMLLKEYDNALRSYQLSQNLLSFNTLLTPKNRKLLTSQAITQIGEVYEIRGQYEQARLQYEASRQIAVDVHSQVNVAYTNERLGDFLLADTSPNRQSNFLTMHWPSGLNSTIELDRRLSGLACPKGMP